MYLRFTSPDAIYLGLVHFSFHENCTKWRSQGICWFRDNARDMIARAFGLRALLAECDILISELHTDQPGQILYKDAFQIIAKPAAATPTVWR